MTKIYIKLIAMALALVLSVSVVIMSSYAWMVLSGNPAVSGIQVAIGGGNTILVAPNIETEEGYNIPGYFSDKMNFATQKSYEYLGTLGGLSPVSTSNGIDWFLSGNKVDSFLEHANLSAEEEEKLEDGSYIYLDFWVVSPSGDYTLRVSSGDEDSGGSFVMDLCTVEQDGEGYTLVEPESKAAAAVRIGFLANDTQLTDDTMLYYEKSNYFDERFRALKGWYQEKGNGTVLYLPNDRFTIYEPNGDSHPANSELDGSYVLTEPLPADENYAWSNLTVQLSSKWAPSGSGTGTKIEELFQTYLMGKEFDDAQEAMNGFYGSYLQGVIAPYVTKGRFIDNSNLEKLVKEPNLKEYALKNSLLKGATEDSYIIKLEQNVPQRIRMFVWIEAQDIDCEAIKNTASFAVNIELAGGNE